MKKEQFISRRNRDINTGDQLIRAVVYSVAGHLAFILGAIVFSSAAPKPPIIVPGYKVSLVQEKAPSSLIKKRASKKKTPPVKKKKKKKKKKIKQKRSSKAAKVKKSKPEKVKKTKIKGKKIVVLKKERVAPPKVEKKRAPVKVEEKAPPKEPEKNRASVAAGIPFPHIWYLKIVEKKVEESWITHSMEVDERVVDPLVLFSIASDGSLSSVTLEKSSGSTALDKSAIEAVRKAEPFPPLPADFPSSTLNVHFGFSYTLRE